MVKGANFVEGCEACAILKAVCNHFGIEPQELDVAYGKAKDQVIPRWIAIHLLRMAGELTLCSDHAGSRARLAANCYRGVTINNKFFHKRRLTVEEIASILGYTDHTTAVYALVKVRECDALSPLGRATDKLVTWFFNVYRRSERLKASA